MNFANALAHLGQFAGTLDAATLAINLDPSLPGAYAAQATALVRLGRIAEAKLALEKGLRSLPDHPLLMQGLRQLPGSNG